MSNAVAISSAAALMQSWDPAGRAPAHRRLGTLLAAIEGSEAVRDDTLGERNRRLLALHRNLVGTPLEARIACPGCATENEFALPVARILAIPLPPRDAVARLRIGRAVHTFRLPRMSDVEALAGTGPGSGSFAGSGGGFEARVIERCRTGGKGPLPVGAVETLGRAFDEIDPAADIAVDITCAGCRRPIATTVDIASFVARDLDRLADGLYRDIDTIASAYGWSEADILALPPSRRSRYVAMIAGRRERSRPSLVGRRA